MNLASFEIVHVDVNVLNNIDQIKFVGNYKRRKEKDLLFYSL